MKYRVMTFIASIKSGRFDFEISCCFSMLTFINCFIYKSPSTFQEYFLTIFLITFIWTNALLFTISGLKTIKALWKKSFVCFNAFFLTCYFLILLRIAIH
jgi:hypothetical protein